MNIKQLLVDYKKGKIELPKVLSKLKFFPFEDLGFSKIDHQRELRKGFPEVIYGENKKASQIVEIVRRMRIGNSQIILGTRIDPQDFKIIKNSFKDAVYDREARIFYIGKIKKTKKGKVLVVTAGTADIPVAQEAALTAELTGSPVEKLYDVGVAGIHRLVFYAKKTSQAKVIIVVAGMDGVLPSVVGGLVSVPVIAVPTSVGYGSSFHGLSALLTMLNCCAPGVVVTNIDNGFGAGYFASLINK